MDKTPHELLGVSKDTQLCFCGPHKEGLATPLPNSPLVKHHPACVIWDWAMGVGKVTPEKRSEVYVKWMNGTPWAQVDSEPQAG